MHQKGLMRALMIVGFSYGRVWIAVTPLFSGCFFHQLFKDLLQIQYFIRFG